MRFTMSLAALTLVAFLPPAALAQDKEPDAACRVLAEAAEGLEAESVTEADGRVTCENLDGTTSEIELQRVDITYRVLEGEDFPTPRPSRQSVRGECGDPLGLEVTLMSAAQKKRPPFKGLRAPVRLEARLSFRARQDGGRNRLCFGSMRWEIEVRPRSRS
jgi:hypothetical protein